MNSPALPDSAAEIRREMATRNADIPEDQQIVFRIGVNLGDIILDDDIQGDGVNIAARLEGLAEPGGIIISATSFDQAPDRLDLAFEDIGEQTDKNIPRPVRACRSLLEPSLAGNTVAPAKHSEAGILSRSRWPGYTQTPPESMIAHYAVCADQPAL